MGYAYSYNMPMEDALGSFFAMSGTFSTINSILGLAAYIFTALSLYTIAKRRDIRKPWLAWIPVLDVWILGSISDQFRYITKGETKSKRKILLVLSVIATVLSIGAAVGAVVMAVNIIIGAAQGGNLNWITRQMLGKALGALGIALLILGVTIARLIVYFMALYDVYSSCDPANNALYLVLSVIPGVATIAQPLLLFLCREKDDGMPPRRTAEIPVTPDAAPEAEPWNQTEE